MNQTLRTKLAITLFAGLLAGIGGSTAAFAHGGEEVSVGNGQCVFADSHVGDCTEQAIEPISATDDIQLTDAAGGSDATDATAYETPTDALILTENGNDRMFTATGTTVDGATVTSDADGGSPIAIILVALAALAAIGGGLVFRPGRNSSK